MSSASVNSSASIIPGLPSFTAVDPDYERRVRGSFARQAALTLIGARIAHIAPGTIHLELSHRDDLTQQHGFLHGGIVSMIADTAGGYAGYTLFPADASVLTAEYKINLLAPGKGESYLAVGRVVKAGRTLCVTTAEVYAVRGGEHVLCALMQQTLMVLHGRPDHPDEKR